MAENKNTSHLTDNVRREKGSSIAGTLTWVGLRAVDPLFMYGILNGSTSRPIVRALGGTFLEQDSLAHTGVTLLDNLQLSPYRLAVLSMTTGVALKHVYWKVFVGEEYFPAKDAAIVSVFNSLFTVATVMALVIKYTSPATHSGEGISSASFPPWNLVIGGIMVTVGLLTEVVSEIQRKAFKEEAANKGKAFTGGLFSLARHINYGGYTVWRAGLALSTGGLPWAAVIGGFFAWDFIVRGIPVLDQYCSARYADHWVEYKKKTAYKLIPFVY